jgi:hypothetical protein
METVFQNKREDLVHFYHYFVKETEEGRKLSRKVFQNRLIWQILASALLGSLLTQNLWWGLGVGILIFLVLGLIDLLFTRFDPVYYAGMEVLRNQTIAMTSKDLEFLQLPRTITLDEDWLEIRSSEALHRWRWNLVDRIAVRSDFIFIHVGNCPVIRIPKRDFSSEASYQEFGKKLLELQENNLKRVLTSSQNTA